MAKTTANTAGNQTADAPAPAPVAAQPVASAAGAMANAPGKALPAPITFTEVQRPPESFLGDFENIIGGSPDAPETPKAKASPKGSDQPVNPEPASPVKGAKAAAADDDKVPDAVLPETPADTADGPLLPDDAAAGAHEDEDEAGDGEDKDAINAKLFKQREKRRAAEAEAAKLREELAAAKLKLEQSAQAAPVAALSLDGAFANVKTVDDIAPIRHWLEDRMELVNEFLQSGDDTFTEEVNGQQAEYSREQIKSHKMWLRNEQRRLPDIEKQLHAHVQRQTQSTEVARKRYPFVFNAGSPYNDAVLEAATEHPELNASPARALALGRIAVAKLVESGKFILVPKASANGKPAAAVPAKPASKSLSPSPASSPAPRVAPVRAAAPASVAEEDDDTSRLVRGDPRAVEAWAASLFEG